MTRRRTSALAALATGLAFVAVACTPAPRAEGASAKHVIARANRAPFESVGGRTVRTGGRLVKG